MSDVVVCTAFICIAAVVVARYFFLAKPKNYYHRRVMADGNLQHAREATGPDPQIVLEMVLYPNTGFPKNGTETAEA